MQDGFTNRRNVLQEKLSMQVQDGFTNGGTCCKKAQRRTRCIEASSQLDMHTRYAGLERRTGSALEPTLPHIQSDGDHDGDNPPRHNTSYSPLWCTVDQ